MSREDCYTRIYAIVAAIPRGKVMTYGQIAGLAHDACTSPVPAITVGRALAASTYAAPDLPWWRVIGRVGEHGVLRKRETRPSQRHLLAEEGINPDADGHYDLSQYLFEVGDD